MKINLAKLLWAVARREYEELNKGIESPANWTLTRNGQTPVSLSNDQPKVGFDLRRGVWVKLHYTDGSPRIAQVYDGDVGSLVHYSDRVEIDNQARPNPIVKIRGAIAPSGMDLAVSLAVRYTYVEGSSPTQWDACCEFQVSNQDLIDAICD